MAGRRTAVAGARAGHGCVAPRGIRGRTVGMRVDLLLVVVGVAAAAPLAAPHDREGLQSEATNGFG